MPPCSFVFTTNLFLFSMLILVIPQRCCIFVFLVYFLICNVNLVHKSPDVCVCSDTCSVPGLRHRLLQHHDKRHEETWLRHRTGRRRRQHTVRHVRLVHRGAAVQNVAKTPSSPKQEIMCKTIFLRPLTNESLVLLNLEMNEK